EAVAAHGAVVCRDGRPAGEKARRLRVLRAAEAEQDSCVRPELVLPAEQRRRPDSPAHEQRAGAVLRCREADAERAREPEAVAGFEARQALGAGADRLEQEREAAAARAREGEGAGQVGPLALPRPPAVLGGEHVELARARIGGAIRVLRADQVVGAEPLVRRDGREPAAEGRQRASHAGVLPAVRRAAWSSWSERTSGSPSRSARMARWAAVAPVMVVMQGMPRATAARRIS